MREECRSPGTPVSRNIWDIQEAVDSGITRQKKQKSLPRSLTAGTCSHADLRGDSDCPASIHGRFLTMSGHTVQNPVLQEGLKRRSTAGTGQKHFFLICPSDCSPAKDRKISASWAGWGWERAPAAGHVVSASEMPPQGKGTVTSMWAHPQGSSQTPLSSAATGSVLGHGQYRS